MFWPATATGDGEGGTPRCRGFPGRRVRFDFIHTLLPTRLPLKDFYGEHH